MTCQSWRANHDVQIIRCKLWHANHDMIVQMMMTCKQNSTSDEVMQRWLEITCFVRSRGKSYCFLFNVMYSRWDFHLRAAPQANIGWGPSTCKQVTQYHKHNTPYHNIIIIHINTCKHVTYYTISYLYKQVIIASIFLFATILYFDFCVLYLCFLGSTWNSFFPKCSHFREIIVLTRWWM